MSRSRVLTVALATVLSFAAATLIDSGKRRNERSGPVIVEPELTASGELGSVRTIAATLPVADADRNLASTGIRVLDVRIGRRRARFHLLPAQLHANLRAAPGAFELGRRYGVVVTYHDGRTGRTDSFRFPEVLRAAAVTVCDGASPC